MPNAIQVLHIFGCMNRGGAELRTLDVVLQLDRDRYRTHFCALSGRQGELDDQIVSAGGEIHYLRLDFCFPWRFFRLLRERRIDVVHSHVFLTSGLILLLAKLAGTPLRIAHFRCSHDGHRDSLGRRAYRAAMRLLIDRCASRVVAVSGAVMQLAWGASDQEDARCEVIYNGIDPKTFCLGRDRDGVRHEFGLPHECELYIHVGNVRPPKNHEKVLSVFSEIVNLQPQAQLLLVGRGTEATDSPLRRQIQDRGLEGRVQFAGVRNDVPRLLRAADLLIFPSLHEGLPGCLLEAAAAGTPSLASDLPVVREIVPCLPGVKALDLRESDARWAILACETVRTTSLAQRDQWALAFAEGQFTLASAVAAHQRLWDSVRSETPASAIALVPVVHRSV